MFEWMKIAPMENVMVKYKIHRSGIFITIKTKAWEKCNSNIWLHHQHLWHVNVHLGLNEFISQEIWMASTAHPSLVDKNRPALIWNTHQPQRPGSYIHSLWHPKESKISYHLFKQKKYGNLLYNCSHYNPYFPDKYSKQTINVEIIHSADTVCYFGSNVLHKHKKTD